MQEFRCQKCRKLLGKIEGIAEIKCPRCGTINTTREGGSQISQQQVKEHLKKCKTDREVVKTQGESYGFYKD